MTAPIQQRSIWPKPTWQLRLQSAVPSPLAKCWRARPSSGIAVFPNSGIADVVGDKQLRAVKLSGRHAVTIECGRFGHERRLEPGSAPDQPRRHQACL